MEFFLGALWSYLAENSAKWFCWFIRKHLPWVAITIDKMRLDGSVKSIGVGNFVTQYQDRLITKASCLQSLFYFKIIKMLSICFMTIFA
jgi:hypothetical protein